MKKVRLLIYEGHPNWVPHTLSASLPLGKCQFGELNSITVIESLSEMSDVIQRMETQREVDDSIPPEEAA